METKTTDVAIIGAGTAGLNARREAEKADRDWLLIESGPYGTTCARVGCMPSKLLIAAADAAHGVREADQFGIEVDSNGWEVDGERVMARVKEERDRFAGFVVDSTESLPESKRPRGRARFLDETTLQVGDDLRVEAETVVIATGSSPWIPPQLESIEEKVLTSADVFDWDDLPESVAVAGTGVVGLELGQALDRLGVDVHLFNPFDEVGIFTDPVVDAEAGEIFGERLNLHVEAEMHTVDPVEDGCVVKWRESDGTESERVFEEILAAAGRKPNVEDLHLEETGVPIDDDGIPEFDRRTMQCGDSPIFIAGDASGHRAVLHEASDEGRIAGSNAASYPDVSASIRRTNLAIAFTHPQMAVVGETFDGLDEEAIAVGEVSYDNQGRARVMGVDAGHVRLYGDLERCTLIGAEMLGPDVEHTAQQLSWVIQREMRVTEVLNLPFYHPVVEEGIRTALRDLAEKLKVSGQCPPEDCSSSPGD